MVINDKNVKIALVFDIICNKLWNLTKKEDLLEQQTQNVL